MRTKTYTIAQLTSKEKRSKTILASQGIYDCLEPNTLYVFDKDIKPLGVNYCREFTCEVIAEIISKGKLPAYIGICLTEELNYFVSKKSGISLTLTKENILALSETKNTLKKAKKRVVSRAHKMSSKITVLEKRFKFKTHTLRCYKAKDSKEVETYLVRWGSHAGKTCVSINISQIWTFTLDPQWLSSPPVTSYFLLCMREFAKKVPSKGSKLDSRKMHQLLSKTKPNILFGKSRKTNWRKTEDEDFEAGKWAFFDDSYGVNSFEADFKRNAILRLRKKFPNNKLFKE